MFRQAPLAKHRRLGRPTVATRPRSVAGGQVRSRHGRSCADSPLGFPRADLKSTAFAVSGFPCRSGLAGTSARRRSCSSAGRSASARRRRRGPGARRSAGSAPRSGPCRKMRVLRRLHRIGQRRLEARPAGAAVELGLRREERQGAARAEERARRGAPRAAGSSTPAPCPRAAGPGTPRARARPPLGVGLLHLEALRGRRRPASLRTSPSAPTASAPPSSARRERLTSRSGSSRGGAGGTTRRPCFSSHCWWYPSAIQNGPAGAISVVIRSTSFFCSAFARGERLRLLLRTEGEDRRPVLRADIGALPVAAGRVVRAPEDLEQPGVADLRRIELDQHRLGMTGPMATDVLVARVPRCWPPGVADGGGDHAGDLTEPVLHAPEAALGEDGERVPGGGLQRSPGADATRLRPHRKRDDRVLDPAAASGPRNRMARTKAAARGTSRAGRMVEEYARAPGPVTVGPDRPSGRALTTGPTACYMRRFRRAQQPRQPPGPRPQGRVRPPSKWRLATATTSSPAETKGALGPGRGTRDARSYLAEDGRREASLSLLPLWLRAARQPSTRSARWEVRQSGEEREGSDDQGAEREVRPGPDGHRGGVLQAQRGDGHPAPEEVPRLGRRLQGPQEHPGQARREGHAASRW